MNSDLSIGIRVPLLTRVEGEGALELDIQGGRITRLQLRIFEPPRLFEKFVEGYDCQDVVEMVARICGICPVAYQVTAVQAFEGLFGIDPGSWVRRMRRALYCGEWLQSHSLHIHLLAAPDLFGLESALELGREQPGLLRRGLRLQALGNDIIRLFGGRSVHPVGLKIGGFHHAPAAGEVDGICRRLEQARHDAAELADWCAGLPLPQDEQAFVSVALSSPDGYAIESGDIRSDRGLHIACGEFDQAFSEFQEPHSTAFHARLEGGPYLVGPLARLNLNRERLPEAIRHTLAGLPTSFPSGNMFRSILARAVEIQLAIHQALELLQEYRPPASPWVGYEPVAGVACSATEAPRGLLWHRYEVDGQGLVRSARIVPPTSQNLSRIEQDLRTDLERFGLDREVDELRRRAEMIVRNYDPCISCATHFLDLRVNRRPRR